MTVIRFCRLHLVFLLLWMTATASPADEPLSVANRLPPRGLRPLDGCAWLGKDGIRAAWLGKSLGDEMVESLVAARVNSVFLSHSFQDLLDMETAHWDGGHIVVEPREYIMQKLLDSTTKAAAEGIHVFWIAKYELEHMLPHLRRLEYQPAYAEGPGRYLPPGPNLDAAPLDRVFWRGITGAHGDLVAKLSQTHPIAGVLYDMEHYAGGMMYLQNAGFSDFTFHDFVKNRGLDVTLEDIPAGSRYTFLKNSGRLDDYYDYLEEEAYKQGRDLAQRWHAYNPHLVLGAWPLLDNWFSQGFLRGLGGGVPSLGLSGVEYYHGSDQSRSMAEFFEIRNSNMTYMPGFYPPYAYDVDELEQHVAQSLRTLGDYWMLSPHKELVEPRYQAALRSAYESTRPTVAGDVAPVNLHYRLEEKEGRGPQLVVETDAAALLSMPRLSLWSTFGGAALCEDVLMQQTDDGSYQARVPLLRRITNNRYLPDGFRSGASYQFEPVPREYMYEDTHHTKLIDGRAYGFFGTTVAWSPAIDRAAVTFDLHRNYRIVQVELSQPTKLEDRIGGPAKMLLRAGSKLDEWQTSTPFKAHFALSGRDYSEPDNLSNDSNDPRHNRAWLSWRTDLSPTSARWLRIELDRTRRNSVISLGEVIIWAVVDGEVEAALECDGKRIQINTGRCWSITYGS